MAKEKKETLSLKDFQAQDNLLDDFDSNLSEEEQEEEQDEDQDEEQEDEKPKKKVEKKQPKDKSEEEESEEESEEEEDEKPKPKKTEKKKEKVEAEAETEEEEEQKDKETEEGEDSQDSAAFFEEVEKLTGVELEVDYGTVDPLSPQGVALREKALQEKTRDSFLEELEENFPQAYKALVHAYNGGDITNLFTQVTGRDYSRVEIKDGDDALAKEILKEYYKSKGVKSDARITTLLESAEESEGGLLSEAKSALDELKQDQESQRNKIVEEQAKVAQEQKRRDEVFVASLDEVLNTRSLGTFKISDKAEAAEFRKFVLGSVTRGNDGKYNIVTPVESGNIEKILQYQFFRFKKGDLGKIIQQAAETSNTRKLKLRLKQEQNKIKKTTDSDEESLTMNSFRTAN